MEWPIVFLNSKTFRYFPAFYYVTFLCMQCLPKGTTWYLTIVGTNGMLR